VEVFVHTLQLRRAGRISPASLRLLQLLRKAGTATCLFFFRFFILENLGRSRDLLSEEMLFCGPPVADDAAAATVGG